MQLIDHHEEMSGQKHKAGTWMRQGINEAEVIEQSRKCAIDLSMGLFDGDIFSVELPFSQMTNIKLTKLSTMTLSPFCRDST